MKRLFCFIIILCLCFSFCGCKDSAKASIATSTTQSNISTVYDAYGNILQQTVYNELTGEYVTTTFTYANDDGRWVCIDQKIIITGMVKESWQVNPALNIYYTSDIANDPIVLLDNTDIRVTVIEYLNKASWWEFGYKFKVENKSNKTLSVMFTDVSIMDINCAPLFNIDHVESGHTIYFNLAWDRDSLERAWIPYVDNIEFMLSIYDTSTWNTPAKYGTRALIKVQEV